ncbi:unnamed protein product [Ambrosiozyma monospora]|uniref:Autophagy-related protein 13 n=1 Tax=Ambrosiozyma monospora TaxID=43982 RepID=A0A9W6Z3E9_AMBMO|nr:unnamed protein product [Ambrosiozyma monospora]
MSNKAQSRLLSDKETDNLGQIITNFFLKSANVIVSSRSEALSRPFSPSVSPPTENELVSSPKNQSHIQQNKGKLNKWFNLEMYELDFANDELSLWKIKDILMVPPLVIETVIDTRKLNAHQTLMLGDSIVKTSKKSEIVLERWLMELDLSLFSTEKLGMSNYQRTRRQQIQYLSKL